MIKSCQTCNIKFDGRRDAKTCSVKCRKRLQRAKTTILHEAGVLKQDAEQVINTLKGEIIPVNLMPAPAMVEEIGLNESLSPPDDNQGFEDSNWHPEYLDLASTANFASPPIPATPKITVPRSDLGTGVIVPPAPLPVSAQPPTPTNEQLARTVQPSPQTVVQPEPTILSLENTASSAPVSTPTPPSLRALREQSSESSESQSVTPSNFPTPPRLDLRARLQALLHNAPAMATLAALTIVMLVGGVFAASKLLHQSSSTPVASNQGDTTFQADEKGKLTLNLDTVLAKGKSLTLGQLIAEPTSNILQLTGDFTASGTLSASGGSTFANNSGLVIDKITVCTPAGCIPNVNIPTITGSSGTAAGTAGAVAILNANNQVFTGSNKFSANSTTAFAIQNAAGTSNLLIADTISTRIGIGTLTPAYTLDVNGDINSTTGIRLNGALLCNAAGCTAAGGSNSYIQNGTALQSANFNIKSASITSVTGTIRALTAQTADLLQLKDQAGVNVLTIGPTGGTLVRPSTDSINGFSVQNALGTSLLISGDTLNARVAIATAIPPNYTLDVGGDINSATGLRVAGNLVCSLTCTPGGGSGNYIQNGTTVQTANFAIQSDLNSHIVAYIRGASGQTADLLDLIGKGIGDVNLPIATFGASGNILFQNAIDSATAFQIQNAAGASNLFIADTTNSQIGIGVAPTPGNLAVLEVSGGARITRLGISHAVDNAYAIYAAGTIRGTTLTADSINTNGLGGDAVKLQARGSASQSVANIFEVQTNTPTTVLSVNATGAFLSKNSTNSTTAFQIQNAAGTSNLLVADTTNTKLGIGLAPSSSAALLQIGGGLQLASGNGIVSGTTVGLNFINSSGTVKYNIGTSGTNSEYLYVTTRNSADSTRSDAFYVIAADTTGVNNAEIQFTHGITAAGFGARVTIVPGATNQKGLLIRGASGQSVNLLQIETSTPATLFSVGATGAAIFQNSTDSTNAFRIRRLSGLTIFNVDTSGSRIGIGTGDAAPGAKLEIGSTDSLLRLNRTSGEGNIVFAQDGTDITQIRSLGTTGLKITNATGTEWARFESGYFGIGLSVAPAAALDVSGILNTQATNAAGAGTLLATITKNDTNSRVFNTAAIRTTFSTGASNTTTVSRGLYIEATNTISTGVTSYTPLIIDYPTGTTIYSVVSSGAVFQGASTASATAYNLSANGLTSGTGLSIASTATALSSGKLLTLSKTAASGSTAFTGDIANITYSQTFNGGVGLDSTGNTLDVSRNITLNNAGNTHTISGALATLSDSATQTAGTLTHTADVFDITQNYASNTGTALNVTTAGTGLALRVNDDGTLTDSTAFVVDASGRVGIGMTAPSSLLQLGSDAGTVASGISFGSTGDTNLYRSAADTLKTDDSLVIGSGASLTLAGGASNILATGVATATTATTSGTGTDTTTVTLTGSAFANNDIIFIDNAGQDYYTRITAGGGTATLTVSPAVTFETGRTVTKYTVQNIGATTTDYSTLNNRFFQGYFLGGVVTGAGSTTLSDGRLSSTNGLQIATATGVNIKNSTDSTTAFQIQNAAGSQIFNTDTTVDSANLVTNGSLEVDTTGWTARGSSTLSRTTSSPTPYLGLGQLKVVTTAAANDGAKYAYALVSTTQYSLTAFARLDSGSAAMATFQMGRSDDGTGASDSSCLTAQTVTTTGWTRFTCTFTTGTTSGSPYVYFKQTDATAHTFYLDAVKLEAAAVATPYREGVLSLNGVISSPSTFKNQSDSTAAFQIQNAAGTSLFTIDTTNLKITLGPASATPVILVLGNKNTSGDPTCDASTAGGIYYNGISTTIRACLNSAWDDLIPAAGWTGAGETWTWATTDGPTFTFTVASDVTTKYTPGMRIKLTQSSVKYFIITAVSTFAGGNTTITAYGGTDYIVSSGSPAISANFYSGLKAPFGFPMDPLKWTVELRSLGNVIQNAPTQNTWYNPGSLSLAIPIGAWKVTVMVSIEGDHAATNADASATLSTANNSESDPDFTSLAFGAAGGVSSFNAAGTTERSKSLLLAAKTTYYLNLKTSISGESVIAIQGAQSPTIIRAVCAYL